MPHPGDATRPVDELSETMNAAAAGTTPAEAREVGKTRSAASSEPLGERLRRLRVAAGLTQTELADGRFSKEYVSQIERGKTRPTPETIDWLAERLGVDGAFLGSGVSSAERSRVEAGLARAEALSEANRHDEAIAEFEQVRPALRRAGAPEIELRALSGEAWTRIQRGEVREAVVLLQEARELAEGEIFSDVDRAEVLFRLGVCRYKLSSISTALGLFDEAFGLAERSGLPCDLLRSNILGWRSRCYRRQRDWEAAREDVERALELAESLNDRRNAAHVYFQASLACSTTSAVSRTCSAIPTRRSISSRIRSESHSRPAPSPMPATSCARSQRCISASATRRRPRPRHARRLTCSAAGWTTCMRSETPSSCWVARSSNRVT